MSSFLFFGYNRARNALERDQGRPESSSVSFVRLVLYELPLLSRRVGPLRVATIVVVMFGMLLGVEILLSEITPGPFLSPRWRVVVAFAGTVLVVVVWTIVHAIRRLGRVDEQKRS